MNNEIKEKYLPIGTVVKLIGGEFALMITGYCVKARDEQDDKYFDYCGCPYPAGIVDSNVNHVFNHDKIEKILYMGYESELHTEYSNFIKETLNNNSQE
ncbi:MAG: DUF4176 domain-containing protein [Bacilli bacterium]|nr:DUF4176 domain-containing protein [Bacilli bacterium]